MLNELGVTIAHGQIRTALQAGAEFAPLDIPLADGRFIVTMGLRLGNLAVHRHQNRRSCWIISHFPSGKSLAYASGHFAEIGDAADAMVEIAEIRDWTEIPAQREAMEDLREQIWLIQFGRGGRA